VKVITPTRLVAEAADVLGEFRGSVVVVGAAAIEVALSGAGVAITPTRDVDVVVQMADAEAIVMALEADGMQRSDVPHGDDVVREWRAAGHEVQQRARTAIPALAAGGQATMAAGGEMVRLGQAGNQRQAEARVLRTAAAALRSLEAH
jgi:hypothetical protein